MIRIFEAKALFMSVLERIEILRENEGLKRAEFERIIDKSSGYLNILVRRNGIPGTDVIAKIVNEFPKYNPIWLLTGEGEMLLENRVSEPDAAYTETADIRKQLNELSHLLYRKFDGVEEMLKLMALDLLELKTFAKECDYQKVKKALEEISQIHQRKG